MTKRPPATRRPLILPFPQSGFRATLASVNIKNDGGYVEDQQAWFHWRSFVRRDPDGVQYGVRAEEVRRRGNRHRDQDRPLLPLQRPGIGLWRHRQGPRSEERRVGKECR